jgi:hypothetical protein
MSVPDVLCIREKDKLAKKRKKTREHDALLPSLKAQVFPSSRQSTRHTFQAAPVPVPLGSIDPLASANCRR